MRQASWNEIFAPRRGQGGLVLAPDIPKEPQGWRRFLWWEDLLTFALMGVVFLAVIESVNGADWVDDMPSLHPIAFLGLLMGVVLARVRWPEGLIHLLAFPVGAAAVLGQILAVVPGPSPWARFDALEERMGDWFHAAFTGGISSDNLPFIVLVVALSWLAAYVSSWAVFRWRNVWLALIPGGWILLMNISYLPGQFSFAFIVFLVGAVLLVARLHVMERSKRWRDEDTPYPTFLSVSVLHVTFWLAVVLIAVAWRLPQANEAGALESVWRRATAPVTERVEGLSRLFVAVDVKKGVNIHHFDDFLPFLGSIELPDTQVLDVTAEPLDQPRYLRGRTYDIYTSTGWRQSESQQSSLESYEITGVDELLEQREAITVDIVSTGRAGATIFSVGQPRRVDRPAQFEWSGVVTDVTGIEAEGSLGREAAYESVGSISVASEEGLRAAGTDYPSWVLDRYLQLPDDFPESVTELALEVTRFEPTAYDQAEAIESYLREIPFDLTVPEIPQGRDTMEFFLFEAQRGYFDYHASAMVVMLRAVGIPSRLAVGYVLHGSERDPGTDRYRVTERSAFAWPEVYFPGLGWVEFNPTPVLPVIVRPGAEPLVPSESTGPEAPAGDLRFEDLFKLNPEEGGPAFEAAEPEASGGRNLWVLTGIIGGLSLLVASSAGAMRLAWVRGLGGLEPPAKLWGQTVRLASWARLPPLPMQTPREYAHDLRERVTGVDEVELLADAYVRYRFGRQQPDQAERERLEGAWRSVRAGLMRRLLRLR